MRDVKFEGNGRHTNKSSLLCLLGSPMFLIVHGSHEEFFRHVIKKQAVIIDDVQIALTMIIYECG